MTCSTRRCRDDALAMLGSNRYWRALWELELTQWCGDSFWWPAFHRHAFAKWFDLEFVGTLLNVDRIRMPEYPNRRRGKTRSS